MSFSDLFRKLPHFKGKFRLARLLFAGRLKRSKDITIKGKHGSVYRLPNLVENIGFEIFADGVYEPGTIKLIVERMGTGGMFIDIGANIGSIAIPVCKANPSAKAICIEASPRVFAYLQSNIAINELQNCTAVNAIVMDADNDSADFYSPEELFGKGSTTPVFTTIPEKTKTVTIDSLLAEMKISHVDLIKIDIEGHEYFAFKGAEQLLRSDKAPEILFEFLDWAESLVKGLAPGDAQRLLLEYGYALYTIGENNQLTKINEAFNKGETMMLATKKIIP